MPAQSLVRLPYRQPSPLLAKATPVPFLRCPKVILAAVLFCTALGALAAAPIAHAEIVWTPETGWFIPRAYVAPKDLLDSADRAFAAKQYVDAAYGYSEYLTRFPKGKRVDEVYSKLLEAQYHARQYEEALESIDAMLKRQPSAAVVAQIVKRKYEIGVAFLSGHRREWFGISLPSESFGVEVLDALVERFPHQSYSDDALYHLAGYYFANEQYLRAEVIYERLIRDYPQSEWRGDAEYQIGASALERLKGVEYDFAPVREADKRFQRYLRLWPNGDRARDAERGLARVDRLKAEKLLGIAQFYWRERKAKAARYYLTRILRDHPKSPAAPQARELLSRVGGQSPAAQPDADKVAGGVPRE